MLRLYDYFCKQCDTEKIDVMNEYETVEKCEQCGADMFKKIGKLHFELKYDPKKDMCGWAHDGYAHSCYWDAVKKERSEGKKVKGANED